VLADFDKACCILVLLQKAPAKKFQGRKSSPVLYKISDCRCCLTNIPSLLYRAVPNCFPRPPTGMSSLPRGKQYSRILNVFHVSLLNCLIHRADEDEAESMPMPDLEGDDEWETEEIKEKDTFVA